MSYQLRLMWNQPDGDDPPWGMRPSIDRMVEGEVPRVGDELLLDFATARGDEHVFYVNVVLRPIVERDDAEAWSLDEPTFFENTVLVVAGTRPK